MLEIVIPETELFNSETNTFSYFGETSLKLEHSLISISKWESIWHKPFISKENKTDEELKSYVQCMTITQNVNPLVFDCLTAENYKSVENYIADPMTATSISKTNNARTGNQKVTSELIYYWMTELNIPPEYSKWHLNRLLTLIEVASYEKQPKKKMSKKDIFSQNRQINEARRKMYNSKG